MNQIVKVDSMQSGKIAFTYQNGERLSIVFDWGTYSDNHYNMPPNFLSGRPWESTSVEVYGAEGKKINEYLEREYGQAPAPYVPVNDIPKILAYVGNMEVENEK